MKRLRSSVGQTDRHVWYNRLETILAAINAAEAQELRSEIERVRAHEQCARPIAIGLILRHIAGYRYQDGAHIDRVLNEIVQKRTVIGILLHAGRK